MKCNRCQMCKEQKSMGKTSPTYFLEVPTFYLSFCKVRSTISLYKYQYRTFHLWTKKRISFFIVFIFNCIYQIILGFFKQSF